MDDIEVKRKELETAKKIRDNVYTCQGTESYISCFGDEGPSKTEKVECAFLGKPAAWDACISIRETELAKTEKTPQDGLSHVQTAPHDWLTRNTIFTDRIPSLDDFALALIQGGYYFMGKPEDLYIEAASIKAESDRRIANLEQGKNSGEV